MQYFTIEISPICYALMGVALLCVILLLTLYRARVASVARRVKDSEATAIPEILPNVSLIVYCDDTPFGLQSILESIFEQEYSGDYEVIVVNDGSSEQVKDVFNRFSMIHSNLYLTFIPADAHNVSRRKLAITLGIKGAQYPHVIIVDASSRIPSSQWLGSMSRHFAQGKDVVIGYATYNADADKASGRRRRSFDTAADAVTYLSAALAGHPYRGHGGNVGYARQLFFDHKGFSKSLNLHNGDDDIFLSRIATRYNTAVELSPKARIELDSASPKALHHRWKWTHRFTAGMVTRWPRVLMGFYSCLLWIGLACAVVASILALPNLIPAIAMLTLGIVVWAVLVPLWRKTVIALGGRRLRFTIPYQVMTRPLYNAVYGVVARRNRRRNFTWNKA